VQEGGATAAVGVVHRRASLTSRRWTTETTTTVTAATLVATAATMVDIVTIVTIITTGTSIIIIATDITTATITTTPRKPRILLSITDIAVTMKLMKTMMNTMIQKKMMIITTARHVAPKRKSIASKGKRREDARRRPGRKTVA
jgi:hypothetical protein